MKKITFSLIAFLLTLAAFAQQKEPFLVFDNETFNFGTIQEEGGQATHKYIFTNTGSMPLIIKEVKPSCGCTTPDWTKEPVLPGNKGFVAAIYNPAGRPGPFNKTVTVTSNATNNPVVLKFNGTVTPKAKRPEDTYPIIIDSIRLTSNFVYFDSIYFGEIKTKKIDIWNVRKSACTITLPNIPKHIKVVFKPSATLAPDQKGSIEITYISKDKNDWGYVFDNLQFVADGKVNANNRITVSADIKEDFAKLSPKQIENAPVIKVNEFTYDFGTVKKGESVKHDFTITNEGKSELIIRKKSASCGCTLAELSKTNIKPGETTVLSATLNTASKSGDVATTITLITNDPKNSKVILFFRGNVTSDDNKALPPAENNVQQHSTH